MQHRLLVSPASIVLQLGRRGVLVLELQSIDCYIFAMCYSGRQGSISADNTIHVSTFLSSSS
jgi:hypothetical protein